MLDFSRKDYDYRIKGTSRKPLFLNRSLDRNLLDFEIVEEPGRDITDETHDLVKEVNKKMNKLQNSLESVGGFPDSDHKAQAFDSLWTKVEQQPQRQKSDSYNNTESSEEEYLGNTFQIGQSMIGQSMMGGSMLGYSQINKLRNRSNMS